MISREAQAELERMFANQKGPDRPIARRRREWEDEELARPLPEGAFWSEVDAGGVASEWMDTPGATSGQILLFLHGGAYYTGSPRTHRRLAAYLGQATGLRVLMPEYRLAPEHPFPAGVEDAITVYDWLREQGVPAASIVVGGDSAGGGLALSMLLRLRETGAELPRAALLLAPWTDLTASSASYEVSRHLDPIITREALREAGLWYAGEGDPADPMMSPLFAELAGLPPMLIHAGGHETMVDDSRILAERAEAAGIDVTARIFPGMWHVFQNAGTGVPEARDALAEIGDYIRALFSA